MSSKSPWPTKRSVTRDQDLVAEALECAGERGLSRVLNDGLRHQVRLKHLRRPVADREAEHGPIPEPEPEPEPERARVRAQWPG